MYGEKQKQAKKREKEAKKGKETSRFLRFLPLRESCSWTCSRANSGASVGGLVGLLKKVFAKLVCPEFSGNMLSININS